MPELPEVETVVRDVNKKVKGRRIKDVWLDAPNLLKKITPAKLKKELRDAKILEAQRRGKYILIYLEKPGAKTSWILLLHQKMTGHLLFGRWQKIANGWQSLDGGHRAERVNQYIHLLLTLDDGLMIALSDVRKFARVMLAPASEILAIGELQAMGLEPFDTKLSTAHLRQKFQKRTRAIKAVLLDQTVMAGLGNIYADDVLWHAQIHPLRPAQTLTDQEVEKIIVGARLLLKKSISLRGASMSTYRDTAGKKGGYGSIRLAYQRTGQPCYRCQTPLQRIIIASRSSHFCPRCQVV